MLWAAAVVGGASGPGVLAVFSLLLCAGLLEGILEIQGLGKLARGIRLCYYYW